MTCAPPAAGARRLLRAVGGSEYVRRGGAARAVASAQLERQVQDAALVELQLLPRVQLARIPLPEGTRTYTHSHKFTCSHVHFLVSFLK